MTDAERAAYWKGAYDRMASRNFELTAALEAIKKHADAGIKVNSK